MLKKIIAIVLCLLCLYSCQRGTSSPATKPKTVVTIAPYAYFVERICQNKEKAAILIPSGSNIHTFEATPKEVERLANLNLWIQIGTPVEERIEKSLLHLNPQLHILNMSQQIPLISVEHQDLHPGHHCCFEESEGRDIHFWMGPKSIPEQLTLIAQELTRIDPLDHALYLEGSQRLIADIKTLDSDLSEALKPYRGCALLLSHPSLGYFCNDYGLIQLSIECNGKDPGPLDLDFILKKSKTEKILCILTQAGFDNRGAELMAKRLNLPIFEIDPYAYDYIENMKRLGQWITSSGEKYFHEKNSH